MRLRPLEAQWPKVTKESVYSQSPSQAGSPFCALPNGSHAESFAKSKHGLWLMGGLCSLHASPMSTVMAPICPSTDLIACSGAPTVPPDRPLPSPPCPPRPQRTCGICTLGFLEDLPEVQCAVWSMDSSFLQQGLPLKAYDTTPSSIPVLAAKPLRGRRGHPRFEPGVRADFRRSSCKMNPQISRD